MWKIVYSLTLPGGLLVLVLALLLHFSLLPQATAMRWYALVIFGAASFLGWRFNRSRVFFTVLSLAMACVTFAFLLPEFPADSRRTVLDAIMFLLPLNILGLSWFKERGNNMAVLRLCAAGIGLQILFVAWASTYGNEYAGPVLRLDFIDFDYSAWSRIPQPAMLAFIVALVVVASKFLRGRRPIEHGLFWSLVAVFLAFSSIPALNRIAYFAGAGAILIGALIENSHMLAYRDELTGLAGRRALNERLLKLEGTHVIAMVDVDHFKKFNDTFGHDCGDQALRMVATRLAAVTGGGEAFRYGGEEFTIVFPDKNIDEAITHLERLRQTIEESIFKIRGPDRRSKKAKRSSNDGAPLRRPKETSVTVSIGVAEAQGQNLRPAEVLDAADKALYRAKRTGRNRVAE
ncbi:MAG: GGDEF domain-containing protein [Acidobacteriales bacterium]|nr:GGDEF domain-containing protein [Terriglobales bacterium]